MNARGKTDVRIILHVLVLERLLPLQAQIGVFYKNHCVEFLQKMSTACCGH